MVQLHGSESPGQCEELRKHVKVIKAFGIASEEDFHLLADYKNSCDYFLFDAKTPGLGGSGNKFDHDLLAAYELEKPYFLSGGLGFREVNYYQSAILDPRHYAIDVNSRFESSPGIKMKEELLKIDYLRKQ